MRGFTVLTILLFVASTVSGQNTDTPKGWHYLDPGEDEFNGISLNKAYSVLQGKESSTVVVAVIDSGIETEHEDLQGSIWVNEDEVAGNGIDDDNNGYIDDINGWNFIGPLKQDNLEVTRLFAKYKKVFGDMTEEQVSDDQIDDYRLYQKVRKEVNQQLDKNLQEYQLINNFYDAFMKASRLMKAYIDIPDSVELTIEMLEGVSSTDRKVAASKDILKYTFELGADEKMLFNQREHFRVIVEYGYNVDWDPREQVGDDYSNAREKIYGSNDITDFDGHGTQIAGIIGANRNNGLGVDGICDNVKIMGIRVLVGGGDERDKDVANAIYYAVDNGADIINMSFGKRFSPEREVVEEAIKYAESKGVLMVHAAGNDHKDTDVRDNFPTRQYMGSKKEADNWLVVGASSTGGEENFVASFSNYGKKTVDIFAPGTQIYTSSIDNDYATVDGTSFAGPVTAGIAALVMAYYPDLDGEDVRDIIVESSRKYQNLEVAKPNEYGAETELVKFGDLSIHGGVVNAYEAVKLAESRTVRGRK